MEPWTGAVDAWLPGFDQLATLALRATLLLLAAWLGSLSMRRAWPGTRQVLWSSVVAGALVLPLLTVVVPAWRVLPAGFWQQSALAPTAQRAAPSAVAELGHLDPPVARTVESSPPAASTDWRAWSVRLWLVGCALTALWLAVGLARLRSIRRRARDSGRHLRAAADRIGGSLGLRRPVRLVVSSDVASPATWGVLRPVVALPVAARRWGVERVELVLAHEMLHVARHDWAVRLLAGVGCIVYWFNPLSWIAARCLRRDQELACDLAVLDRGALPSTYASHLLDIARGAAAGRGVLPMPALDLARRSQMEGRLMSILADRPVRRLRRAILWPALSVLLTLPVLAAVQPAAPAAPEAPAAAAAVAPALAEAPSAEVGAAAPAVAPVSATSPEVDAAVAGARPAQIAPDPAPAPSPAPEIAPRPSPGVEEGELERRIALRAAEMEAVMEPLAAEIEALMEPMQPILEQMERVELDMEPLHREMSRLGAEMGEMAAAIELPEMLEMEELGRQAEILARQMEERARLAERAMGEGELGVEGREEVVRRMREEMAPLREELRALREKMAQERVPREELRARMAPYRERMEELRRQMEPQRQKMEELRLQLEPLREELAKLREEQLLRVHERMEALRQELRELERERRRRLRESLEDGSG